MFTLFPKKLSPIAEERSVQSVSQLDPHDFFHNRHEIDELISTKDQRLLNAAGRRKIVDFFQNNVERLLSEISNLQKENKPTSYREGFLARLVIKILELKKGGAAVSEEALQRYFLESVKYNVKNEFVRESCRQYLRDFLLVEETPVNLFLKKIFEEHPYSAYRFYVSTEEGRHQKIERFLRNSYCRAAAQDYLVSVSGRERSSSSEVIAITPAVPDRASTVAVAVAAPAQDSNLKKAGNFILTALAVVGALAILPLSLLGGLCYFVWRNYAKQGSVAVKNLDSPHKAADELNDSNASSATVASEEALVGGAFYSNQQTHNQTGASCQSDRTHG